MGNNVYKGVRTGELVVVNCPTGMRLVKGLDCIGRQGCDEVACACGSSDMRFKKASPEETEVFWRSADAELVEVGD